MIESKIKSIARSCGISFGGHPMNPLNVYPSDLQKFSELIKDNTTNHLFEKTVLELHSLLKPLYMDEDDELNSEYNCAIKDAIYTIEKLYQQHAEPVIADNALTKILTTG